MTTIERFGLSWTAFKTVKNALATPIYEGAGFTYRVWLIANESIFECHITASADITDYQNNYRANAITVESGDLAYGLWASSTSGVPVLTTGETVSQYAEYTSTTTTADQQVTSYTVPTGKNFYLISFHLTKCSVTNVGTDKAVWQKNGVNIARSFLNNAAQTATTDWIRIYPYPIPVGTAGDVFRLLITPSATAATVWSCRLTGLAR